MADAALRWFVSRPARRAAPVAALLLLRGAPVLACPVCIGSAPPRVLDAYLLSAALLSLLPLVLLAVIGGWLYVLARRNTD